MLTLDFSLFTIGVHLSRLSTMSQNFSCALEQCRASVDQVECVSDHISRAKESLSLAIFINVSDLSV